MVKEADHVSQTNLNEKNIYEVISMALKCLD